MSTTRERLIEELFQAVYELGEEERRAFLDRHCADAELRAEVELVLRHERRAPAAFLSGRPPPGSPSETLSTGDRVGRFTILGRLGEGGMGTVYEAEQEHPRRSVALKIIRGEPDDPELLGRFRREIAALAALQHPGIAQIYEAGTRESEAGEQPFFAMELVRGRSLSEHARQLERRARIELVARICDAVQHAHQRGIIHRDLKPENILVVPEAPESAAADGAARKHAGVGQPKIVDFGIARVANPGLRGRPLKTRVGHLIGTLEYMSPEQIGGVPADVDTRSDVYSLGVILFELLTGRPPIDLAGLPLFECARRVREDPPLRDASLDGDLAAVCATALEKEVENRYQSAGDLAEDLRRCSRGEPVSARRHSTFYLVRKTLHRHRFATVATMLTLGLLATAGVVSGLQALRNKRLANTLTVQLRTNDIERGRALARADNVLQAEDLLWREHLADPSSRHSLWALWELYSIHPILGTWASPGGPTLAVAFHPDGRRFATGGADDRVHLFGADGPGPLGAVDVASPVLALDFHPRGEELAVATAAGRVVVVDPAQRTLLRSFAVLDGAVTAVRYTPDGCALVVAGDDGLVRIEPSTGGVLRTLIGAHRGPVLALALAPDGSSLATGGTDDTVLVRALSGDVPALRLVHPAERLMSLAWSADGDTLASGGSDKLIRLWDTATGREIDTLEAANGSVRFLAYPKDDGALVSGGWWSILRWASERHERSQMLATGLRAGAFSPNATLFATGDNDLVRLWDVEPRDKWNLRGHAGPVVAALRSDGALLATGDEEGVVRTFDALSGRQLRALAVHGGRVRSLAFEPKGERLLAGSETGVLALLDLRSGEVLLELADHVDATTASAAFGPDGKLLAHTCEGGRVRVHDVATGKVVHEWRASDGSVLGVAFAPDGSMATTDRDGRVRLWSAEGEHRIDLAAPQAPWRPVFSHDGTRLAVAAWEPTIRVYDVLSGELEASLRGHRAVVWDVAFAPDDASLLASASDDGTVKLWDVDEERCLATLDDFDGWDVFSVSFGPDGVLAAGGRRAAVVRDLTYYERHIAANAAHQLERLGTELDPSRRRALEEWAARVLARPWPRFAAPPSAGR